MVVVVVVVALVVSVPVPVPVVVDHPPGVLRPGLAAVVTLRDSMTDCYCD